MQISWEKKQQKANIAENINEDIVKKIKSANHSWSYIWSYMEAGGGTRSSFIFNLNSLKIYAVPV